MFLKPTTLPCFVMWCGFSSKFSGTGPRSALVTAPEYAAILRIAAAVADVVARRVNLDDGRRFGEANILGVDCWNVGNLRAKKRAQKPGPDMSS